MAITDFTHKNRCYRRVTIDPISGFTVGVDLGKSVDSTVIAILEYNLMGKGEFREDEGSQFTILHEKYTEQFDLRELQRIKLETSYDQIVDHVVCLMNTRPLKDAELVIDDSGVGRPIGDMLEAQTSLRPVRVTTTAGEQAIKVSQRRWHVPKAELVSTLSGLFSTNRIRVAHDLPNLEVLRRECQSFLRNWTGSGRATFSASGSNHDDTISALSLACWWASMKNSPAWSRRRGGDFYQGWVKGMN
jgi:hypothetical protein